MQTGAKLNNLRDLIIRAAELYPGRDFFLCSDEKFPSVSGAQLFSICKKAVSVLPYSREKLHIALLGPNSAAWIAAYFAVMSAGHIVVPLHYGMKQDEVKEALLQADCDMLIFDEQLTGDVEKLSSSIPGLVTCGVHSFIEEAEKAPAGEWPVIDSDEPAAMYFTSGTTSKSRCVILTHRNLAAQANTLMSVLPLTEEDSGLSILPLSHTFEMMAYVVGALHCGGTLYINESLRSVKANLKRCQPTILVVVPLILQTLKREIERTAAKQGRLEELKRGIRLNEKLRRFGIHAGHRLFADIHETFGGRLKTIICGGASLDPEIIRFYRALDIEILQGYGITECSPVVSVNTLSGNRPGSIGRALDCCEVSVINGEICVRGDSVSPGYYHDEEANDTSFIDGWFHTGDLGYKDRDGYLYYTGRIKNLIILSNGENVSPEEIEERLYRVDGIRDALVYEHDGKITAEIYADPNKIPDKNAAWKAINPINKSMAQYKQIGDILLRDVEFEKTATNKIKRYKNKEGCA